MPHPAQRSLSESIVFCSGKPNPTSERCGSVNLLVATAAFAPTRVGFVPLVPCASAAFRLLVTSHALLRRSVRKHTVEWRRPCPEDENHTLTVGDRETDLGFYLGKNQRLADLGNYT